MEIEVFVLFKDIVINDLNLDLLVLIFWVEGQSSLHWDEIGSSIGSSIFSVVVDQYSQSFWSSISEEE